MDDAFSFTEPILVGGEFHEMPRYGHLDVTVQNWEFGEHRGPMLLFRFQYLDGKFMYLELRPEHLPGLNLVSGTENWLADKWGRKITIEITNAIARLDIILGEVQAAILRSALTAVAE